MGCGKISHLKWNKYVNPDLISMFYGSFEGACVCACLRDLYACKEGLFLNEAWPNSKCVVSFIFTLAVILFVILSLCFLPICHQVTFKFHDLCQDVGLHVQLPLGFIQLLCNNVWLQVILGSTKQYIFHPLLIVFMFFTQMINRVMRPRSILHTEPNHRNVCFHPWLHS